MLRPLAALALAALVTGCGRRPALPPTKPTARYATTAAIVQETVYVVGGVERGATGDTTVAAVEAYDPVKREWTRCAPMATARAFAAAVEFDNRVYVFGGVDASGKALDSAEVYDPQRDAWTAAPSMASARGRLAAVNHMRRSILVAGGIGNDECNSDYVRVFHPDRNIWKEWPPLPTPRHGFALVDADDQSERVFAVGGYDEAGPLDRTDRFGVGLVKVLRPDGKPRWPGATVTDNQTGKTTPIDKDYQGYGWWTAPPLAHARGFHAMARLDTRLFAVGGRCATIPPTEVLDISAVDAGWKSVAPLPKDLCRFSMVAWNGRLLVFGGETDGGKSVNADVLEYDPDADAWTVR